jgi:chemotaxis protein MotA
MAAPLGSGTKLDISTLAGLGLALTGLIGGLILERGAIEDIVQGTAALIVLGGTFGAVLVTTPGHVVWKGLRSLKWVFLRESGSAAALMDQIIRLSSIARRSGIVSLEDETPDIADPFLRKALDLAVDGTGLQEIQKIMENDIDLAEQYAEAEAKVWESAGGYAPTIGIIGAVMGLIQVMKHLEDIKEVGHGIAVAFVATVYGVGCANLLFLPAASKLRARARRVALMRQMALEGVTGIVEGVNSSLIRAKLESYNNEPAPEKNAKNVRPREAAPIGPSMKQASDGSAART